MNTRRYAISLVDKRIVLCTQETLSNIDYHLITEALVKAIEDGTVTKDEVIAKIKGKLMSSPEQWDELIKSKKALNMRRSKVTRESTDSLQTTITDEEAKDAIDVADVEVEKTETKKGRGKKTADTETPVQAE